MGGRDIGRGQGAGGRGQGAGGRGQGAGARGQGAGGGFTFLCKGGLQISTTQKSTQKLFPFFWSLLLRKVGMRIALPVPLLTEVLICIAILWCICTYASRSIEWFACVTVLIREIKEYLPDRKMGEVGYQPSCRFGLSVSLSARDIGPHQD